VTVAGNALVEVDRPCATRRSIASGVHDGNVGVFYACTYCRMHTPDHVCIITPEMPGQCSTYDWSDARRKSSREPAGMQRPVSTGRVLSVLRGEWEGVNAFVSADTRGTLRRLCLHSLMDAPPPVSPCCECIVAVFPEANGVVVVDREYTGMTPLGMTFAQILAHIRGKQTQGFFGCARRALLAEGFLAAEGGRRRVVWMPRALRYRLGVERCRCTAAAGMRRARFTIADEGVGVTPDAVCAFLRAVHHPAGTLSPLV